MSKSLGTLKTHYQSGSLTTAECWLIVLTNGTQIGFTDYPQNLTIDGQLYEGNVGFDRSAVESTLGLGADNHNLVGVIDSSRITAEDIQGRRYFGARVYHFSVDYTDPDGSQDKHGYGFLGEIKLKGNVWDAEYTSLATLLERELGELRSPYCRVELGSSRCGVALAPDAWTSVATVAVGDVVANPVYDGLRHVAVSAGVTSSGVPAFASTIGGTVADGTVTWEAADAFTKTFSVTSVVASQRTFIASVMGAMASGWYQYGKALFTTGNNSTVARDVKTSTSGGQVEVLFEYPFVITVGDTGTLTAGCEHLLKKAGDVAGTAYTGHCRTKFDNAVNYQGDPEIPGVDILIAGDSE